MGKKTTEVVVISDRSGSMASVREEAEGALNHYLDELRGEKRVFVSLAEFDDHYALLYSGLPAAEVPKYELVPRGMTALLDAIGKTVNATVARQKGEKSHPRTVVVIVTDGAENHSREWSHEKVTELIAERKKADWEFLFLAAGQEAIQSGSSLNLNTYNINTHGYYDTVAAASVGTRCFAASGQSVNSTMATVIPDALENEEQ